MLRLSPGCPGGPLSGSDKGAAAVADVALLSGMGAIGFMFSDALRIRLTEGPDVFTIGFIIPGDGLRES